MSTDLIPPVQILRMSRGQDADLTFSVTPPVDITGWTIVFEWFLRPANTLVLSRAAVLVTPLTGVYKVSLTESDTASVTPSGELPAGSWYDWQTRRTNVGSRRPLARGRLFLYREGGP
jgi:hypothetical protein